MLYSCGIDVGKDGAVALVSECEFIGVWDVPTVLVERQKHRGKATTVNTYDVAAMWQLLLDVVRTAGPGDENRLKFVIEKVHAMPDQGATSMFTFGRGLGLWEGLVAATGVSLEMPAPQTWKKAVMRDGPKTEQAAVALAGQLYPAASKFLRGPRGGLKVDRAEAILIARFGLIPQELPAAKPRKRRQKSERIPDPSPSDWPAASQGQAEK